MSDTVEIDKKTLATLESAARSMHPKSQSLSEAVHEARELLSE